MEFLKNTQKIYFVGVKGIAMAALAVFTKERGFTVIGSDTPQVFPSDSELKSAKIPVVIGFNQVNIDAFQPDLVIYTGAHGGKDNREVAYAIEKNIPVMPHGEALGLFMGQSRQISVAGSHGKTTTSSMLALITTSAGLDPSYAVGTGEILGLGFGGHAGAGDWFVAEADEYVTDPGFDRTPRFMWQNPEILIVSNIDYDHPDVYPDLDSIQTVFFEFAKKVPENGTIIINGDDIGSRHLTRFPQIFTVGTHIKNMVRLQNIQNFEESTQFEIQIDNKIVAECTLLVPGLHNVLNAGLAAVAAHRMGIEWPDIVAGLKKFTGTKRRFEYIDSVGGVKFYDDYAHHPVEIKATLAAARKRFGRARIFAVFQPHTYSRTQALLKEFAQCFTDSDVVILTNIYASAREETVNGFTGLNLVHMAERFHKRVFFADTPSAVTLLLRNKQVEGDIVIFMGAGDIYNWSRDVIGSLSKQR